jgi:protocatechuate 3,4-dioxygenase beta subunit
VADFNGDGVPDILLKNGTALGVWCCNANGSFNAWIGVGINLGAWVPVGVADFNGDGVPDILLKNGTALGVWCCNANGSFNAWIGVGINLGAWTPVGN